MKRIIIVGATSGIGLEIAKCYIRQGWLLGIAGRREEALKELQQSAPDQVKYKKIDVTDENADQELKLLIEQTGGMDVFLLSSGIGSQNSALDSAIELNTLKTNVEGFTRMLTSVYAYFSTTKKGHIAIISSVAGTRGLGVAPAYSASKRFQSHYLDALAQLSRLNKQDIRFTDIRPGFVATDLLKARKYPLLMQTDYVAFKIVKAIEKKKRVVIIDYRYRILVFLWRFIPQWIWERLPIK